MKNPPREGGFRSPVARDSTHHHEMAMLIRLMRATGRFMPRSSPGGRRPVNTDSRVKKNRGNPLNVKKSVAK